MKGSNQKLKPSLSTIQHKTPNSFPLHKLPCIPPMRIKRITYTLNPQPYSNTYINMKCAQNAKAGSFSSVVHLNFGTHLVNQNSYYQGIVISFNRIRIYIPIHLFGHDNTEIEPQILILQFEQDGKIVYPFKILFTLFV